MATVLLDRVTDTAVMRAEAFAEAEPTQSSGDDVGMQHSIMMSETLYDECSFNRGSSASSRRRGAYNPTPSSYSITHAAATELIPYFVTPASMSSIQSAGIWTSCSR